MKILASISVFIITLIIGCLQPTTTPTIYEKIYPSLTQVEIKPLIGKKVINKTNKQIIIDPKYTIGIKFTLNSDDPNGEMLQNGETGKIVSLPKTLEIKTPFWNKVMKKCGLFVKWDKKSLNGNDMFSCHSRYTKRLYLEIQ